jgi:hypothetical protein
MTEKPKNQIVFNPFYEELKSVRDKSRSPKQDLYANLEHWAMLALNEFIKDTGLEDMDAEERLEYPALWEKIEEEKGISIINFLVETLLSNIEHHNMIAELANYYEISPELLEEELEELIEEAVSTRLNEYGYDF